MKCPKCGYLGFETSDRCRNCGYDFSLSIPTPGSAADRRDELPLNPAAPSERPVDLDLSESTSVAEDEATVIEPKLERPDIVVPLPLFPGADDDEPLLKAPRPPRAPLAVRRATPEPVRSKVTPSPVPVRLPVPSSDEGSTVADRTAPGSERHKVVLPEMRPAPRGARLLAAAIDAGLLLLIDASIVYLTLTLSRLPLAEAHVLPWWPIAVFFVLLNGGYLVAFVAAGGQTIGKMLAGVRVMGDDGQPADLSGAVLRAVGCGASLLTLGLGYLPALASADGRALQDRISGTRVVSAR